MKKLLKHYENNPDYVLQVHQRLVKYLTANYEIIFNETERAMFKEIYISQARGSKITSTLRNNNNNDLIFRFSLDIYPLFDKEAQTLEQLFPEFDFSPKSTD